ncbi:Major facilitator superfamily domain-containing protein 10 [Neolecta irregularis DAH-3]|uniref:Major facilitator superfamily domain-containing protein 10 n=1 Tax=Neolecta irregularis (strain DAH-3) TaxID=1198029 RepID=A0A1U7LTY7_NEOID|nr:Major facilitator superfamily domain-containing protein 10 [Neolecta irregularis DAH-3]|eukprot:OLL26089.1 Major facilitator superfamily domain-containing protein 10 [Neolecta irregularis DAH-3]
MCSLKHQPVPEKKVSNRRNISAKAVTRIVFVALILDLLAFTLILPLFPRMIEYYLVQELSHPSILSEILKFLNSLKPSSLQHEKWDTVLLGGVVGSLFSLLQCVASPIIGSLSDRGGRRRTLLLTMFGNILSCSLWLFASNFYIFLASRIVGGLSEGNVQLSIAIISDITTSDTRSRGLAMVGIAFAISFTIGPALGAYFAHFQADSLPTPFACSALIALGLLIIETLFIAYALPETMPKSQEIKQQTAVSESQTLELEKLGWIHFGHLLFFSGLEFSLTAYSLIIIY